MSGFNAWVGKCHIRDEDEVSQLECYAAVWAQSLDEVEIALQQHFRSQSQSLLLLENAFPIMQWLQQYGHNNAVMDLAKVVQSHHKVELGAYKKVGEESAAAENETQSEAEAATEYLTITEHEVEPLADQSQIPVQYQEWITPDLKERLFGQPDTGKKLRTYFIVDPTLRKKVAGEFDLDSSQIDVPVTCLFKGKKAEELKESAPYLLDMTLSGGAWNSSDSVPDFHKDFFKTHWGEHTGIFIRTTALFDEVWRHFRKFTRVQMEEDKRWVFFRFWDPRTISTFIEALDENDTHKFLSTHQVINPSETHLTIYSMTQPLDEQAHAALPPFIMKEVYIKAFSEQRTDTFIDKLSNVVSEQSDAFAKLEDDKQTELLTRLVKQAKQFGIESEQAVANFVLASVQFGKDLAGEPKFENILTSTHHEMDRTITLLREVSAEQQ